MDCHYPALDRAGAEAACAAGMVFEEDCASPHLPGLHPGSVLQNVPIKTSAEPIKNYIGECQGFFSYIGTNSWRTGLYFGGGERKTGA
jgi:hypothetical protein